MQTAVNPQTGERVQWNGSAWVPVGGAPAAPRGPAQPVIRFPQDPTKVNREERADRADQRDDKRLDLAIESNNRAATATERQNQIASRVPDTLRKTIDESVSKFSSLTNALSGFKDEFGGNPLGRAENMLEVTDYLGGFAATGIVDPGQREFWSQIDAVDNAVRNEQFGATLTPGEKQAYARTTITPGMTPKAIKENLGRRVDVLKGALERQRKFALAEGYNQEAVDILFEPILRADTPKTEEPADAAPAGVPFDQQGGTGYNMPGGGGGLGTGGKQIQQLIDGGMTAERLNEWSQSAFGKPIGTPEQVNALIAQRRAGQEIPDDEAIITPNDYVDPALFNQLQEERGASAGYNLDAAVRGAADTLTAGSADRIAAAANTLFGDGTYDENLLRERTITAADEAVNPLARAGGQLAAGFALPGAGITSIPRAAGAGAGYGTVYGFQSDYGDVGDRLASAVGGAAVGAAGGAAGGYFGQKLLNRINGGGGAPKPPSGAARVGAAKKFGVDLPMEAAGGRGAAIVGNTLSNIPGSAQAMQTSRNALTDQVVGAVDNVAETFGPTTSFPGIGEAVQTGARKWMDKFDGVVAKVYEAIPISAAAPASLGSTIQALSNLTSKFQSNPQLAAKLNSTRLKGFLDDLAPKIKSVQTGILDADGNPITRQETQGGGLSWQDLKDMRTRIGEEIGLQPIGGEGTLKSELRTLYGALSDDMRVSAAQQGPKALKAFERANTLYRQGQERIDNALTDFLGKDGMMSANAAAAKIQALSKSGKATGDLKKLAAIRKSMPKEEWGEVSNGLIRLLGQPANSAGREFQADVFVRNFKDMAPEAKNLLFGKSDLRANLDEFAGVMQSLADVNALRNTSNTAGQVLTGSSLLALDPTLLVAQAVGSYGAARLWTDPRFVRWATGYAKMQRGAAKAGKQPSNENIKKQLELLGKTAGANSPVAAEVTGVQSWMRSMMQSANDNAVAPLAAEPTDERGQM